MLIVLSDDVALQLLEQHLQQNIVATVTRLLSNYADGHHIILLAPRYCKAIEQRADIFSNAERASAAKIRARHADYGDLVNHVRTKAIIVSAGNAPQFIANDWHVPVEWIAANPLTKSHLVCEDLYDISVMRAAGEDHLRTINLNSFVIQASPLSGGGNNTHRVLADAALVEQKICLCIVDSDKTSPTSNLGNTAAQCTNVLGDGLYMVVMTNGRSIENSIPWRLINRARRPDSTDSLVHLERNSPTATAHLDFKGGFRGHDLKGLPDQRCVTYWTAASVASIGPAVCCATSCQAVDHPNCTYRLHEGFGRTLLKDVGDWLQSNQQPRRHEQYIPSPNHDDWHRLGGIVADYALGIRPMRI